MPLMKQIVDCVFEEGGVAPVILWRHEDECGEGGDGCGPGACVGVCVFGRRVDLGGDGRLVVKGKG